MRVLYEDVRFAGESLVPRIDIREIGLPTTAKRDIWIRVECPAESPQRSFLAYGSRSLARSGAGIGDYHASWLARKMDVEMPNPPQTIVLDDNPALPPDMTGLTLICAIESNSLVPVIGVWGYTASPDVDLCDEFVSLLQNRMGPGLALAHLDPATQIGVGDPDPWGHFVVPGDYIAVFPAGWRFADLGTGTPSSGIVVRIEVKIITIYLSAGRVAENAMRRCRQTQAQVESILGDEETALFGRADAVVITDSDPPTHPEENPAIVTARSIFEATLTDAWRDYTFPRVP